MCCQKNSIKYVTFINDYNIDTNGYSLNSKSSRKFIIKIISKNKLSFNQPMSHFFKKNKLIKEKLDF